MDLTSAVLEVVTPIRVLFCEVLPGHRPSCGKSEALRLALRMFTIWTLYVIKTNI